MPILQFNILKIFIKYRIYPIFGLKMQLFWFFYTNKRTGGVGAKPPQTIKLKI